MTTVWFVRHAESDRANCDEMSRGLSPRGMFDRQRVTQFFSDCGIEAVYSSPYRRAVDTVKELADSRGLPVLCLDGLREWHRCADSSVDFMEFCRRHWENFDYRYADGESLRTLQRRNIDALTEVLSACEGENVIIGTHGMALSSVIACYDSHFGFEDFQRLLPLMPLIVRMTFVHQRWIATEFVKLP